PGSYNINLKAGSFVAKTKVSVLPNPEYTLSETEYSHFDSVMNHFEKQITDMHNVIEKMFSKSNQLIEILKIIPSGTEYGALRDQTNQHNEKMQKWEEKMVKRKTKAYDDVENFENKFTAGYLFLMNHADSGIPKINLPSLERKEELDGMWRIYRQEAFLLMGKDSDDLNRMFWEKGMGAVWK